MPYNPMPFYFRVITTPHMKQGHHNYPLVRLPQSDQVLLCLIREELKANRFFNGLAEVGLEDCYFQPHLTFVILTCAGFDDLPDDLIGFYLDLLDTHSEKIEPDQESIMKEALGMYAALKAELKKRHPEK